MKWNSKPISVTSKPSLLTTMFLLFKWWYLSFLFIISFNNIVLKIKLDFPYFEETYWSYITKEDENTSLPTSILPLLLPSSGCYILFFYFFIFLCVLHPVAWLGRSKQYLWISFSSPGMKMRKIHAYLHCCPLYHPPYHLNFKISFLHCLP